MRSRLTFQDGVIIVGVLLLFGSIAGLYVDAAAANAPRVSGEPGAQVVAVVTPTTMPDALLLPAETLPPLQPSLTPFTRQDEGAFLVPVDPTLGATLPPINGPQEALLLPEPTAVQEQLFPDRIVIPVIGLDAPVQSSPYQLINIEGQTYQQWQAPNGHAVGWQFTSALLGVPGNTVFNGHHNVNGSVFARLEDLSEGDAIEVHSGNMVIIYEVSNAMILAEEGQPLSSRLENARWLQNSADERLTLVTCWPQWDNTHRLIIVARPVGRGETGSGTLP